MLTDFWRSGSTSWVAGATDFGSTGWIFNDFAWFLKIWVHELGPRAGATDFKAVRPLICLKKRYRGPLLGNIHFNFTLGWLAHHIFGSPHPFLGHIIGIRILLDIFPPNSWAHWSGPGRQLGNQPAVHAIAWTAARNSNVVFIVAVKRNKKQSVIC